MPFSPAVAVLVALTGLCLSACSDADLREWPSAPAATGAAPTPPSDPPGGEKAREPRPLLPDLTTLPATGLLVQGTGGGRVLRFGTTLANVGRGPLETTPDPTVACPPEQRSFVQVLRIDDGDRRFDPDLDRRERSRGGACVLFHPTHQHWHIDGSSRYELLDPTGASVVARRKVSFCLRDSDPLPGADAGPRVYEACSRDRVQGISPGWGDLYDRELDGQSLALAGVPDGPYCLRMTADPFDYFREVDEANNASHTPVRLRGNQVTVGGSACGAR